MEKILIYGAVLVLAFICVLVVLFILMQRPSSNAGMGSALGGATTESVFGGESASILSKATSFFIISFFVLCTALYLSFVSGIANTKQSDTYKVEVAEEKQPETLITKDDSEKTVKVDSKAIDAKPIETKSATTATTEKPVVEKAPVKK